MQTNGGATSLQGSLEAFALADVLRLLAATSKSGHLAVEVGEATGGLWLDAGLVAAAAAPAAGEPEPVAPSAEALFELLRRPGGAFAFAGDVPSPIDAEPRPVEPLLDGAGALLAEWREIQAVVPSLDAAVALRPSLTGATATISAEHWRLVVAIGGGTTVAELGAAEDLGEIPISRVVKALVEAGFVTVEGGEVPTAPTTPTPEPEPEPEPEPQPEPEPDPEPEPEPEPEEPEEHVEHEEEDEVEAPPAASGLGASLGELASLSAPQEPAEPAAQVAPEPSGTPVDRSSLLKMLSSVRT